MQKKLFQMVMASGALLALMTGCEDKDVTSPEVLKQFTVKLNATHELPAPPGRLETGRANFTLFADNRLQYTVQTNALTAGDRVTMAHVHTGDAGTNGPVSIGLDVTNGENTSFGGIVNLSQAQADQILGKTPAYVNVHSTRVPSGLMRGQIETQVVWAREFRPVGTAEVPSVVTPARGFVWFRLTADGALYSNITVSGLPSDDAITAAHIHTAAAGVNGPVAINLFPNGATTDLAKTVKITLTAAQLATLTGSGPIYVNIHSTRRPGGIIRSQIR